MVETKEETKETIFDHVDKEETKQTRPSMEKWRARRHFWSGTKLPSMGCLVTVFSYLGFKQELRKIVCHLSTAGSAFYYAHLDNDVLFQSRWKSVFPMRKRQAVHDALLLGNCLADPTLLTEVCFNRKNWF